MKKNQHNTFIRTFEACFMENLKGELNERLSYFYFLGPPFPNRSAINQRCQNKPPVMC